MVSSRDSAKQLWGTCLNFVFLAFFPFSSPSFFRSIVLFVSFSFLFLFVFIVFVDPVFYSLFFLLLFFLPFLNLFIIVTVI